MKPYMFTTSGRKVWLDHPTPADIELPHIAAALSGINRFTGLGWSDAQHSVLVSRLVPCHLARWGLLHDACEAYLGDVTGPLKSLIGTAYGALQDLWCEAVSRRFDTPIADVKPWDQLAGLIEARDSGQLNPHLTGKYQMAEWFDMPAESYLCENTAKRLACYPPTVRETAEDARALFLARCAELEIE
jgi:uncharacterized protein